MAILADIYRPAGVEFAPYEQDENGIIDMDQTIGHCWFGNDKQLLIVNIAPEVEIHNADQMKAAMIVGGYLAGGPPRIVPAVAPMAFLGPVKSKYVALKTLIEQDGREMSKAVFGDGFVFSSDLRWKFNQPLPLHDRYMPIGGHPEHD